MAAELKSLLKQRGNVKAQMTRMNNSIRKVETLDKPYLDQRKERLEEHYNSFNKIQIQIEELTDSEEQAIIHEEFENLYYECADFINRALHRINTPETNKESINPKPSNSSNSSTSGVIPKIHIQPFDGNYAEWQGFYDTFRTLVHENNSIAIMHKFHLLKSYLTDRAASVISALGASEENYTAAWKLVQKRFNKPRKIIQSYIRAIFDLPEMVKESPSSLRVIAEGVEMHVSALKCLNPSMESDDFLIYIITAKLDQQTRNCWERSIEDDEKPTFADLLSFLNRYSRDDELVKLPSQTVNTIHKKRVDGYSKPKTRANAFVSTRNVNPCPLCKQAHYINQCPNLMQQTPQERLKLIKSVNLCVNCLRNNHSTFQCHARTCQKCNGKHHTLLHFEKDTPSNHLTTSNNTVPSVALTVHGASEVLLATARVTILDKNNQEHDCRVLLDPGSQSNFMTEKFANTLQLPKKRAHIPIVGVARQINRSNYSVCSHIKSKVTGFSCQTTFLTLPVITNHLPSRQVNASSLQIPEDINLADPEFYKPAEIDALLGEYLFYQLLLADQIRLSNQTAVLQNTKLGWILSGGVKLKHNFQPNTKCFLVTNQLDNQIAKFWELEKYNKKKPLSPEEMACETAYSQTTNRDSTGRYIVRLPFNEKRQQLGESHTIALKRFFTLERKLHSNPTLREQYSAFLDEYERLGHMLDITETAQSNHGYYLPHHAVMKSTSLTTKVRVVFDGSARSSTGISLNDTLMVGPTIQDDIFALITRFRSYSYVLTADIEKMYRQIKIHPEDASFQKILWRKNPKDAIKTYQLDTVTYGTASAPFLAVRTLHQLATDNSKTFPLAANVLKNDFYVDDLLTGANTLKEAEILRNEIIDLLNLGGFHLRQWATNEPSLIEPLKERSSDDCLYLDVDDTRRTLGIVWTPRLDTITYETKINSDYPTTKRNILSNIAQLFDPLGLLGPVIIKAKIIMQQLWKCGVGWDDLVPLTIHAAWVSYTEQLPQLNTFAVPREILLKGAINIQLHGFCDASEIAYGACVYLRSSDPQGNTTVRLVAAKSRVAPVKTTSLPRLELCAAELLSKLFRAINLALKIAVDSYHFWSDSTIALHWIKSPPHTLKTFVANRVAKIQELTETKSWKHINSLQNPADSISRGQLPTEFLQNHLWLSGPDWLSQEPSSWPVGNIPAVEVPDRRTVTTLVTYADNSNTFNRFSSIMTLQRVIAYCMRFYTNASQRSKITGPLTVIEIRKAHNLIIKNTQAKYFPKELTDLKQRNYVSRTSKILALSPFIDREGIIRVGGRLHKSNLSYTQKHPILLPRSSHITHLIIRYEHHNQLHAGVLGTLNAIRQRYWLVDGKNVVRFIVRKCIRCFKTKPIEMPEYSMGNLPKSRVTANRPFQVVGIDYCGPFFIKEKRFRNTKKLKVYVAVFICFVTKEVHLEVVSDLSTEAFMATLKRFFARRGYSQIIYSDNATNFVGAKRLLDDLQSLVNSETHQKAVIQRLANKGITWRFSPPRSPHFGGLWEAAVKSFKHHFYRTVGDALFTFEEFNTYVIEIEAILNSRPLIPLSPDPNDLTVLTPAHFLIGESLTSLPEHDLTDIPTNRLSFWQHIQRLKQHFWSRWHKEYLNEINIRTKWRNNIADSLKVGTLVLLKDDNLPPLRWSLGRIIEIHPGDDNIVRVVTLKTNQGVYKRSIRNICPLPVDHTFNLPHKD